MRLSCLAILLVACGGHHPSDPPTGDDDAGVDAAALADAALPDGGPLDDPFTALVALPGTCTPDGWCWRTPRPHGNDYVRTFATAPDNIWLTARQGTIMQWNGHTWIFHHPPVLPGEQQAQFPMSIGGSGPTNMWLIYGTTLQQWDGTSWTIRDSLPLSGNPNFNNVWVAPDGVAWVTQSNGTIKRWHGATSDPLVPCSCFLGAIWGTAPDDVFITTLPAGILHYDGTSFTYSYQGPNILGGYQGVHTDAWVSGGEGDLMHWDGATWTPVVAPPELANRWVAPIAYINRDDVWWWVTGRAGFLHWDGQQLAYTAVDANQDGGLPSLTGTMVDGRWWLVGNSGAVYTRSGPDTIAAVVRPELRGLQSMWGAADDDLYFAFGGNLTRWDGATMTNIPIEANKVAGLRTGGVDELFATGYARTADNNWITTGFHYDGTSWVETDVETRPLTDRRLFAHVTAIAPGEAIAVGERGIAYHYAAGHWKPITSGVTADLYSVFAPDADHAWIAGAAGTLLAWNRASSDVLTPDPTVVTPHPLGPVHGAAGIVWVAEPETASVWRHDATGWLKLPAVTVGNSEGGGLFAVGAANMVMASAGQTLIGRWNGTGFTFEDNGSGLPTPVVFEPAGGPMLAGGNSGLVQHP